MHVRVSKAVIKDTTKELIARIRTGLGNGEITGDRAQGFVDTLPTAGMRSAFWFAFNSFGEPESAAFSHSVRGTQLVSRLQSAARSLLAKDGDKDGFVDFDTAKTTFEGKYLFSTVGFDLYRAAAERQGDRLPWPYEPRS